MVYYFMSDPVPGKVLKKQLYMGKHKEENEELIKYGWDEDVWFHVDNLSSAHVYLRLSPGESIENIDKNTLEDIAQLTKANSIHGNKQDNITIIYTKHGNLFKTGDMAPGQVGFKRDKDVYKIFVQNRKNYIINRLNKTRREEFPNLKLEKDKHKGEIYLNEIKIKDQLQQEMKIKEYEKKIEKDKLANAYDDLFTDENLRHASNQDRGYDLEDEFW